MDLIQAVNEVRTFLANKQSPQLALADSNFAKLLEGWSIVCDDPIISVKKDIPEIVLKYYMNFQRTGTQYILIQ